MDQYIIKGGNPLVGEVEIGGAKNAALAILAAAIMTDETVRIENLLDVNDINVLLDAIAKNTLSTTSQEKSAVGKANTLATAKRIFLLRFAAAIRANFEISIPAILAFLSARAFSIFPV